mmetsp:Transcript_10355/g.12929  ORF Transcript_10355/g.12929 Transcript_10355/m.12929 type:complete len:125 (+) Transcript_10355:890-1264(+)
MGIQVQGQEQIPSILHRSLAFAIHGFLSLKLLFQVLVTYLSQFMNSWMKKIPFSIQNYVEQYFNNLQVPFTVTGEGASFSVNALNSLKGSDLMAGALMPSDWSKHWAKISRATSGTFCFNTTTP